MSQHASEVREQMEVVGSDGEQVRLNMRGESARRMATMTGGSGHGPGMDAASG